MPKNRYNTSRVVFYKQRKFLGINKYVTGDIAGKELTYNITAKDADLFEDVMDLQVDFFENVANNDTTNETDGLIESLTGVSSKYDAFKNFILNGLTIVNKSENYKNQIINLRQQIEILNDDYEKLLRKYHWLELHCGEHDHDEVIEANIKICTNVEVDMDIVYVLYQHFFGNPIDGVWDEEKTSLIIRHLENKTLSTIEVDDNEIKIRQINDPIKLILKEGPSATLENTNILNIGNTLIETNIMDIYNKTDIDYGITIGQPIIIGFSTDNVEYRFIVGINPIILNKPLEKEHIVGSIIIISGQTGRNNFLNGEIININGKFISFDIELDIGGILTGVPETLIEDGKDTRYFIKEIIIVP